MQSILIFIDWFTPGYKAGGPVSSNVNLITHFKSEYHFKVVTRNNEYMETKPYPDIIPDQWIQRDGFEGFYISSSKLSISALKRIIKRTDFDVAYVNGIYSLYFSILPLLILKYYRKKALVSARGMLSPHALAVKSLKKSLFLKFFKYMGLYRNVTFHATNEEEKGYIRQLLGENIKVKVAPNLPKKLTAKPQTISKAPGILSLIYIGRIAPEKNTLFALQVLTKLKLSADITFYIYGSVYSKEYWEQCEHIIRQLPANIKVIYAGAVEPALIPEALGKSHFLFQPSLGENYGHTIAESLQNAVPVIISDRTPWRNLEEVRSKKYEVRSMGINEENTDNAKGIGWDIPLENPERFVEVIEYCAAMGQEEYDAMSRRAFEYARQVTEDPEVLEANRRLFL